MPYRPIDNLTAFQSRVTIGDTEESRFLDFKAEYRWQTTKHSDKGTAGQAEELCRDIAQFANTDGGTVLVGVRERSGANNRKVADGIEAVDDVAGFKGWLEEAIRNHLTPSTFSHSVNTIDIDGQAIVAINVPPSIHLVALWRKERKKGIEYLYRTDHGKNWMNPDEVERHIMNGSRAARLAVAAAVKIAKSRSVEIAGGLWLRMAQLNPRLERWVRTDVQLTPDNESFALQIAQHENKFSLVLPYGVVREAWVGADGRVNLLLSVRIVNQDNAVIVEPWHSAD